MLDAGLQPLEPYQKNSTKWKCRCLKCKRIIFIRYSVVNRGGRCAYCSKVRIDPKEAEKAMRENGYIPLVPYPGSDKKWKCRCQHCNTVTYPRYLVVVKGHKCRFCAGHMKTPQQALKMAKKVGLKPLEPYPGQNRGKWKCIHLACGEIIYPMFGTIRRGYSGCRKCSDKNTGLKSRVSEKEAIKKMINAKLQPLEPYVNSHTKWKCKCLICETICYPLYATIVQRGTACKTCGTARRGIKRRTSEDKAINTMLKANLEPLESYTNTKTKWKCRCQICQRIVYPTLGDIVNGDGGCGYCSRTRVDVEEAIDLMLNSQLKPLEPYKNSKAKWKCQCLKCGKIVNPSYEVILQGQGGCRYCAVRGIQMNVPSYLYLITHSGLNAHKVGMGNHKKYADRLTKFKEKGWETYRVWNTKTGADAIDMEAKIFDIIRNKLKIPVYLSKDDMPETDGHTETMDADLISLIELEKIINKVIKGLQE